VGRLAIHEIKESGSPWPQASQHFHEPWKGHHCRLRPCKVLHVFIVLTQWAFQGSWHRITSLHVSRRDPSQLLQLKNRHLGIRHHHLRNAPWKFSFLVLQAIKRPQELRQSPYSWLLVEKRYQPSSQAIGSQMPLNRLVQETKHIPVSKWALPEKLAEHRKRSYPGQ